MRVEYSSNNSGGDWWLEDEDWQKLEAAGWNVIWGGMRFCHSEWIPLVPPVCASVKECRGHRRFESYGAVVAADDGRWLGALAREATKDFPSLRDAIAEWESVTGKGASDEGCGCCGPPHSFSGDGEYASGDECAYVLAGRADKPTLRQRSAHSTSRYRLICATAWTAS